MTTKRTIPNFNSIMRSYVSCEVSNLRMTQCIREDKYLDGDVDCRNRADEEFFQTGIGNSSSLLLDLESILIPCNISQNSNTQDKSGFKCSGSGSNIADDCLWLTAWCDPTRAAYICNELKGKTATQRTTDPLLCQNQSFWEHRNCNRDYFYRCNGETPGQCEQPWSKCKDGSSEIKPAQGGDCRGKELMCRGKAWSK